MPIDDAQFAAAMTEIDSSTGNEAEGQPASPSAPDNAGGGQPDKFAGMTQEQREEAEQSAIDNATPEQRKTWDKTFVNALSRRDKDRTRLKAENAALVQRVKNFEEMQNSGKVKPPETKAQQQELTAALQEGEPDISKYDDFNKYLKDVRAWDRAQLIKDLSAENAKNNETQKTEQQKQAAAFQTEQKLAGQFKELITQLPELGNLFHANADVLEAMPQPIADVVAEAEYPVLALMEIAKVENGLQNLSRMSPARAAMIIGVAERTGIANYRAMMQGKGDEAGGDEGGQGQQPAPKRVSNAPAPMKAARGANSAANGTIDGNKMNADQIFEALGWET